jgi:putative hydrolase of HD superfamily
MLKNKKSAVALGEIFAFSTLLEEMKKIERFKGQYYWRDYPMPKRYESNADHSWRLAMMVLTVAPELSKKFNLLKGLQYALLHDLPEIITGDASPLGKDGTGRYAHAFNAELRKKKQIREKKAMKTIVKTLGAVRRKHVWRLWEEYERQDTFEARVVRALDTLEADLQILEYLQGKMMAEHFTFTEKYLRQRVMGIDPFLDQMAEFIVEKFKKKFKNFRPKK